MSKKNRGSNIVDLKFSAAHMNPDGHCSDIAFHPSGETLYTCGFDGITVFDVKDKSLEQKEQLSEHKEPVNALAVDHKMGERLASCSDDHCVNVFRNHTFDKQITKFQLPVRHVAWSYNSVNLAAAGDDGIIKIVLILDTTQIQSLKGHEGPIRSLAYDPKDKFLVSAGCDGTIKIWCTEENKLIKSIPDFITKSETSDAQFCRIAWHPNGEWLAVPTAQGVKCLTRDSWNVAFTLKESGHSKGVTLVKWSPNGRYLASAGMDMQIFIWDLQSKENILRYKHDSYISGLSWHPSKNFLAVIDVNGKYAMWDNPVPAKFPSPFQLTADLKPAEDKLSHLITDKDFEDLELEDLEQEFQQQQQQQEESEPAPAVPSATSPSAASKSKPQDKPTPLVDPSGVIDYDDQDMEVEKPPVVEPEPPKPKPRAPSRKPAAIERQPAAVTIAAPTTAAQSAFQPGSTAAPPSVAMSVNDNTENGQPQHRKRYFMAFNKVGYMVARDEHTHISIDIEFHDLSKHSKPLKLTDRYNSTMGALCDRGAIFASKMSSVASSTLSYQPFDSWGTNTKWVMQLIGNEDVTALGVTNNYLCIGTNFNFLRFMTVTGMQYHIISAPGPIVSINGISLPNQDLFIIAYHKGAPFDGNQCLGYMIVDVVNRKIVAKDELGISPKSTLTWIGFSDEGIATTSDSNGVVRMLLDNWNQWTPVAVLEKSQWLFGVSKDWLNVLLLKGQEIAPATHPRPVPSTVSFKLPFLHQDLESAAQEQMFLQRKLFLVHREKNLKGADDSALLRERATLDTVLIKLVDGAVKNDKPEKAFSYCHYIQFEKPFAACIQLASQKNYRTLAEKMQELLELKFHQVIEEEEESEEEEEEPSQVVVSKKSSQPRNEDKVEDEETQDGNSKAIHHETSNQSAQNDYRDFDDEVSNDSIKANKENDSKGVNSLNSSSDSVKTARKKNRFAQSQPLKTTLSGTVFDSLNKLQESSNDPKKKKRKLQSFFN